MYRYPNDDMRIFPCDGTVAGRRAREDSEERKMTHLYGEVGGKPDLSSGLAHFVLSSRTVDITERSCAKDRRQQTGQHPAAGPPQCARAGRKSQ